PSMRVELRCGRRAVLAAPGEELLDQLRERHPASRCSHCTDQSIFRRHSRPSRSHAILEEYRRSTSRSRIIRTMENTNREGTRPAAQNATESSKLSRAPPELTIVGIGASAGGLGALKTLFGQMPASPGV